MTTQQQLEFLKTVSDFFDGTLTDAETEQLMQRLATDAEAHAFYFEILALDVDLEWSRGRRQKQEVRVAEPTVTATAIERSSASEHEVVKATTRPLPAVVVQGKNSFFSRSVLTYVALVAICVYGSFTFLAWNLRRENRPATSLPTSVKDLAISQFGDPVQLTRADDARWIDPQPTEEIAQRNRTLQVQAGLAELDFAQAVEVVVEGPAEFEVRSPNSGFLRYGKLVAKVSKQGIGFTVSTPTATIVDLGTEFGVEVKKSGETAVHVFQGTVETSEAPSTPQEIRNDKRTRVEAGESLVFDGSTNRLKSAANEKTFSPLSKQFKKVPLAKNYSQAVLADRPLAYWPLNEPAGSTEIADRSGNGHVGKVKGEVVFGCEWPIEKSGSGARFEGNGWIEIANATDLALERDFSVEAWLRSEAKTCETSEYIFSVSNWGWGREPSHQRASPLYKLGNGRGVIYDIRFDLPEWRHVAYIFDANDRMYFYIGGRRLAEFSYRGVPAEGTIQATIGAGTSNTAFWNGSIAHLAVYPRALDAKTIAMHLQSATRP